MKILKYSVKMYLSYFAVDTKFKVSIKENKNAKVTRS